MAEISRGGVEIVTDPERVSQEASDAVITVRTGQTGGEMFLVKINQPAGRALLVAVHL